MSHISLTRLTGLKERGCIVAALGKMGYTVENGNIRAHGDAKTNTEFRLKEKPSIGFQKVDDGYTMVHDFWNTGLKESEFTYQLQGSMNEVKIEDTLKKLNWSIDASSRTVSPDGKHIQFVTVENL